MKRRPEIEIALEKSLRSQVKVPRLDERFDAAVWARIETAESRATSASAVPVGSLTAARWLTIINFLGLAVVALMVWAYGAQMFAGADFIASFTELSAASRERIVSGASLGIAAAAVLFGFMYTPWGRRLRQELG
jgi:hypothetical protein